MVKIGFGWGVIIPEGFEKQCDIPDDEFGERDLWDEIEENYQLLEWKLSGDYWNGSPSSVVVIKSSLLDQQKTYSPTIINDQVLFKDEAGLQQLFELISKYKIPTQPGFLLWGYHG